MTTRTATAMWQGQLKDGKGTMKLQSGAWSGPYTFNSRFGNDPESNPEELLGAAHAGCFSMFLSALLGKAGYTASTIQTTANVSLGDGPTITKIHLDCSAIVPGVSDEEFQETARAAKAGCPVSKALAGPEITLSAVLKG